jgi:hypothetical protein
VSKYKNYYVGDGAGLQGFYAHISMSGFKNPLKIKKAFREMEDDSYNAGRDDKAHNRGTISLKVFARDFDEFCLPPAMLEAIIKANYAVYLDGYHGREFKSRTVCEEI